ncbi:hypothetical protein M758_5G164700 [Ceratodon purpureus]|nr:hypothetical protein M758_5G164700 [Ceratodon purpureus]
MSHSNGSERSSKACAVKAFGQRYMISTRSKSDHMSMTSLQLGALPPPPQLRYMMQILMFYLPTAFTHSIVTLTCVIFATLYCNIFNTADCNTTMCKICSHGSSNMLT